MAEAARRRGFTLIEVLAVVFLTGLLVTFAMGFFANLSQSSERASRATRDARQAISILDRVARDLEGTFHVSEDSENVSSEPHPWLFLADIEHGRDGSDQLRFATTSVRPRSDQATGSDIATIAYSLRRSEWGGFELLRQVVPGRPLEALREFPRGDEEGTRIIGDGIADFGVHFVGDDGSEVPTWDSTTRVIDDLPETPVAARIEIELIERDDDGELLDSFDDFGAPDAAAGFDDPNGPQLRWSRSVVIPMSSLPYAVLTEGLGFLGGDAGAGSGENEGRDPDLDPDCTLSIGECISQVGLSRARQLCSEKQLTAMRARPNVCLRDAGGSRLGGEIFCLREACGL